MNRFRLHRKAKGYAWLRCLAAAFACVTVVGIAGYGLHSIGTARAKSREMVILYTEEEFSRCLLEKESEEYNLNGRYQLGEDLDLSWLEQSIGTNIEPFTGTFDGDGHVISGLARPLFGVLEKAEVENLFFSEVNMVRPFTYSDGENYVDGYGVLAAYAVNSRIQSCGMSGEIHTASPSEAEYQLAKASWADADEQKGPGREEGLSAPEESGTLEEESTTAGPANEVEESPQESQSDTDIKGPAGETSGLSESEASSELPEGALSEPSDGTSSDSSGGTANESSGGTSSESTGGTTNESSGGITNESTGGTSSESTGGTANESTGGTANESTGGTTNESTGGTTNESSGGTTNELSGGTTNESFGGTTNESTGRTGNESTGRTGNESTRGTGNESTRGAVNEASGRTTNAPSAGTTYVAETVGCQSNERQYLMMKVSAVMDADLNAGLTATPSDATPSDAKEVTSSTGSTEESQRPETVESAPAETEPFIEYIGNPDGDIYILVTAGRITVGGLVAETAGETLISDSFALVTVDSNLEETENYAGGIVGILGYETRVENSYATGLLDSSGVSGGFAAQNNGMVENCYSTMSFGKSGEMRGVFTALGDGTLSGCTYDKQMASIDEPQADEAQPSNTEDAAATPAEAAPYRLKGFNTREMTGPEAKIPGNWYTADHAYPQLEYFALSEDETILNYSKVSVVALILPDGTRLCDVLKDGEVILPYEVDGQEITWDAEGGIWIDEENQLRYEGQAAVVPHEPPTVGASMESKTEETSSEPLSHAGTDKLAGSESGKDLRLKVSVGNVSRSYALTAVEPGKVYTNWMEVGLDITEAPPTARPEEPAGTKTNPYLLDSAEDLAWFSAQVNTVDGGLCATMTADIDLFGGVYADVAYNPDDLSNGLPWRSITKKGFGTWSGGYSGVFDGGNHTISNLILNGMDNSFGLFGTLNYGGIIKNLGIKSGYADANGNRTMGIIVAMITEGKVLNCWNAVDILNGSGEIGGIAGYMSGPGDKLIEGCYNFGKIDQPSSKLPNEGVGGILGHIWTPGTQSVVKNCYNLGSITSTYNYPIGGILGNQTKNVSAEEVLNIKIENCYNAGLIVSTQGQAIAAGSVLADSVFNCYYDNGKSGCEDSKAMALTTDQLASWAAAYALNGQSRTMVSDIGLTWVQDPAKGYPVLAKTDLERPESWMDIGQGISDGLIKSERTIRGDGNDASPYLIGNAEELALFATKVNGGGIDLYTRLVNDIDLTGVKYGGTTAEPIPWYPIGTVDHVFQGSFDGNGKVIGRLTVRRDGYAGLFGCAGNGARITGLGLDSTCHIVSTGTTQGNGTAALVANVKSNGTSAAQITIQNCFSRATVQGASGNTGAFVGGFEGTDGVGTQKISNCYMAGSISSTSGTPGAIAGAFTNETGGGIQYCYWDSQLSGAATKAVGSAGTVNVADTFPKTTAQMKSDEETVGILAGLNKNLSTGTWERTDSRNDGYPIFWKTAGSILNWEMVGEAMMAPSYKNHLSASTAGTTDNPYLIWTAEDLAWFANQVNHEAGKTGLCAQVMADINLFGGLYTGFAYATADPDLLTKTLQWIPIGGDGGSYTGTFNGNGHTITAIRAEGTGPQGVFGTLGTNANVKDVVLSSIRLRTDQYAGGIAGYIDGTGVSVISISNIGKLEGSADYLGGMIGAAGSAEGLVIDGCYNSVDGSVSSPGKSGIGGILGGALPGSGAITVRNCYNRGNVSGGSNVGGIMGSMVLDTQKIIGCYNAGNVTGTGDAATVRSIAGASVREGMDSCFYESGKAADDHAKELTQAALKTWGMAFALNNGQLWQPTGITWDFDAGNNDGYPWLTTDRLGGAGSWEAVGEAASNGLIDGGVPVLSETSYQIGTATQMAWFAYRVNHVTGETGIHAELTADIYLKAEESQYDTDGRMTWIPIGKDRSHAYTGTFCSDPDSGKSYQVHDIYVSRPGDVGLFGTAGSNAKISDVGIINADITGNLAGGIAGYLTSDAKVSGCYIGGGSTVASKSQMDGSYSRWVYSGGIAGGMGGRAVIARCYNEGGNSIISSGSDTRAGGIAGITDGTNPTIEDCYVIDAQVSSTGTGNAPAGGIAALLNEAGGASGTVRNCYSAGSDITSASGTAGGILGERFSKTLSACYSETLLGEDENHGVKKLGTTDMERQSDVDALNTTADGERKGTARVWFTSLVSEATKGFPTLCAPLMYQIEMSPAAASTGTTVSLGPGISIPDALLRGIHLETDSAGTDTINLTAADTMVEKFHIYGTDSGNVNLGLKAGTKDVSGLVPSLAEPKASLGTFSQLTLYSAAAYTHAAERKLLLEVSSGTNRYEVLITIPGVTGKLLDVILPASVNIEELSPGETEKTACSDPTVLTSNNDYPVEGKIVNVASITPTPDAAYADYRELKLISKDSSYGGGQIYDAGVKLGITNLDPATGTGGLLTQDYYYNPDYHADTAAGKSAWMKCQLKANGTFQYRYFLKYQADPYYDKEHPKFGYIISYQFNIMKDDYTAAADAVVSQ